LYSDTGGGQKQAVCTM